MPESRRTEERNADTVKSPRPPHPRPDILLRFLRREATRAESRAVIRHLLTGCRECIAVTRPVWKLADAVRRPQFGRTIGEVK